MPSRGVLKIPEMILSRMQTPLKRILVQTCNMKMNSLWDTAKCQSWLPCTTSNNQEKLRSTELHMAFFSNKLNMSLKKKKKNKKIKMLGWGVNLACRGIKHSNFGKVFFSSTSSGTTSISTFSFRSSSSHETLRSTRSIWSFI